MKSLLFIQQNNTTRGRAGEKNRSQSKQEKKIKNFLFKSFENEKQKEKKTERTRNSHICTYLFSLGNLFIISLYSFGSFILLFFRNSLPFSFLLFFAIVILR